MSAAKKEEEKKQKEHQAQPYTKKFQTRHLICMSKADNGESSQLAAGDFPNGWLKCYI